METRSKEEIVIRVTDDPKEVTIYPASESALPENVEEIVHIDTVEDGTQDRPLSVGRKYLFWGTGSREPVQFFLLKDLCALPRSLPFYPSKAWISCINVILIID